MTYAKLCDTDVIMYVIDTTYVFVCLCVSECVCVCSLCLSARALQLQSVGVYVCESGMGSPNTCPSWLTSLISVLR